MSLGGSLPAEAGLPARLSEQMRSVWARHAGSPPVEVDTVIRANTVVCRISGGTVEFSEGMVAPPPDGGRPAATRASTYESDAVAAVVEVTGQRVSSMVSRNDADADVATEVFTLEESLLRGRSRGGAAGRS